MPKIGGIRFNDSHLKEPLSFKTKALIGTAIAAVCTIGIVIAIYFGNGQVHALLNRHVSVINDFNMIELPIIGLGTIPILIYGWKNRKHIYAKAKLKRVVIGLTCISIVALGAFVAYHFTAVKNLSFGQNLCLIALPTAGAMLAMNLWVMKKIELKAEQEKTGYEPNL